MLIASEIGSWSPQIRTIPRSSLSLTHNYHYYLKEKEFRNSKNMKTKTKRWTVTSSDIAHLDQHSANLTCKLTLHLISPTPNSLSLSLSVRTCAVTLPLIYNYNPVPLLPSSPRVDLDIPFFLEEKKNNIKKLKIWNFKIQIDRNSKCPPTLRLPLPQPQPHTQTE